MFFFPKLVKFDPCVVANVLDVLEGINFACRVCISFHVGMFVIFDSSPESIKKQFQGLVIEIFCFLDSLREVGLSKLFPWVVVICLMWSD